MISVLLPTVRPERSMRVLGGLLEHSATVPLEIVVVADFEMPSEVRGILRHYDARLQWYVRGRKGVVDAVNVAYGVSTGDVVFLTNDETTCRPDCLRLLHDAGNIRPDVLWTPRHVPHFPFFYYGKFFAAFPCAHKDLIAKLGGLLDPVYRGFYSDPDLSLRAHALGVQIDEVPGAIIDHHNTGDKSDSWAKYFHADQATFRSRWDHLGEFRDP